MPENNNNIFGTGNEEKNDIFDLPKTNDTESISSQPQTPVPNTSSVPEQKPIIEIPQEYYDKLEQERLEKEEQAKKEEMRKQEQIAHNKAGNKIFSLAIFNAIIFFVIFYVTLNYQNVALIALPIYIVVLSLVNGIKNKKDSDFPLATMIGGLLTAIITFVLSMVQAENMDLWTYYAIACAITGMVGYVISSMLTWIIYDYKNIKAVQSIGILLFFAILILIPGYLYKKYPEEFYKIVFRQQTEVVAETEEEFILKTLKNRYSVEFTCENDVDNFINSQKQMLTSRTCTDPNGVEVTVQSIDYNRAEVKYIIQEDYLDKLYLNSIKEEIENYINTVTGTQKTNLSLYPKENCSFIGDCVDCEEYFEIYKTENDKNNQYEVSTKLKLQDSLNLDKKAFINQGEYKYIISVNGTFTSTDNSNYEKIVNNILQYLNTSSYKNNFGYEITIKNTVNTINKPVYKVKGTTNDSKAFTNPEVVKLD